MSTHTPRSFEVPTALVAAGFGPTVDLDVLDREVAFPGEFGDWAAKVLFKENTKILESVCSEMRLLPRGIVSSVQIDDESILISGLVDDKGRVWDSQFNAWGTPSNKIDTVNETVILTDNEVAFVARAMMEKANEVWFRPYIPKAFVSAITAAPDASINKSDNKNDQSDPPPIPQNVPAGSAIVAVVDPIDEDAVLEMLAITPGPRVLRRHNGNWFEDSEWVSVLKSVKPPSISKLTAAQIASVTAQVDRSTVDQDWEPFEISDREQYQVFTASSYIQELQKESDEKILFSLVAVSGKQLSPQDAKNTEKLKKYWTIGKGAAKIRWGTPGSWSRCYRHLVKYVGPTIAPGYCTNLSKRLGGPGVATHVTSSIETVVAANPSGVNGYDKGKSFEESTGGVERDVMGKFAKEGPKSSWYESQDTITKKPSKRRQQKNKEAQAAAKRAREERQKVELAKISLEIATAKANGNTIRAAELGVSLAEKRLTHADTESERINAQIGIVNAKANLLRARLGKRRKSGSPEPRRRGTGDIDKALSDYNKK